MGVCSGTPCQGAAESRAGGQRVEEMRQGQEPRTEKGQENLVQGLPGSRSRGRRHLQVAGSSILRRGEKQREDNVYWSTYCTVKPERTAAINCAVATYSCAASLWSSLLCTLGFET